MTKLEGYNKTLTKSPLFNPVTDLYSPWNNTLGNLFSDPTPPGSIASGDMISNFSIIKGYLKSSNYQSGINGWKIDALGNAELNSAVIRGSVYAESGLIGGWVIDNDGLFYNGFGTPNIRTSAAVGAGADGVILDSDGIRGYSSLLGNVFNLPSDGSAPYFSSGIIEETIFEVNTNAVIRTSENVGDGSVNSAGVLINNSGLFATEANQILGDANVRILNNGSAYFKGTVNASNIVSSVIDGSEINGAIITGGMFRTSANGQRTEITDMGIVLQSGATGKTYGDMSTINYQYGRGVRAYGDGVLGYLNNQSRKIPYYINAEQDVGDAHFYNRTVDPTGDAEIGDLCVVNGRLKICTVAGSPGGWTIVGDQTTNSSPSASQSPSQSLSPSISPSYSLSLSPSLSPSFSPSQSISSSLSPSISSSKSPSFSPSQSLSQSISPSLSLSLSPSNSPSKSPSISPSYSSSVSPSFSQSLSSSISSSYSPSYSPSQSPSQSISPSLSPSISPSNSPSLSPSISQSYSLSISPSFSSSISPSPSAGSPQIVDSYSESNGRIDWQSSLTYSTESQSFTGDGGTLNSVKFYLAKEAAASGTVAAKIYAHTGTFGTTSVPTGSALATSDSLDSTTFPLYTSSFALQTFTFTGADKITLTNGTKYCVTYTFSSTGGGGSLIRTKIDDTIPTHGGNLAEWNGSSWDIYADSDLPFYVYKDGI